MAPGQPPGPPPGPLPPPEPLEPAIPWWQHQGTVAVAMLIALLAGGALGYLIGSSNGKSTHTTTTEAKVQTVTRLATATAPAVTHVVIHTTTVTATTSTPTAPPSEGGGGHTFSGSGTTSLGTLSVARNSTLRWTCTGECGRFSIFNSSGDENSIGLASGGHSGAVPISAGTYTEVKVTTGGAWTVKIE